MKVQIKLYRIYHHYLQPEIKMDNGLVECELTEGSKLSDLLYELNIPPTEVKIMMVNSKPFALDGVLKNDDYVFIFPPVAGG